MNEKLKFKEINTRLFNGIRFDNVMIEIDQYRVLISQNIIVYWVTEKCKTSTGLSFAVKFPTSSNLNNQKFFALQLFKTT